MRKLVMLILALGIMPTAYGQYRMHQAIPPLQTPPYESDILSARPVRYFVGLGLGALFFQHNGEFIPDPEVCNCTFGDLDDVKFHYAGELSIQYPKLGFALKLLIQYQDFSGVFQYQTRLSSVLGGDNQDVSIDFEKTSNVELSYLSVAPGFAYYFPRSDGFVLGGIDFSFPIENQYDNLERILTPGFAYDSLGTQFDHTFLEKSEIPEVAGVRIGLMFALGYDFKLTNRFYLTPQVGATLPLTPISDRHESWKVTSEYGLLIIKYRL